MKFSPEAYKIDQISIGCLTSVDVGRISSLDSYQEHDLNRLKDKCRSYLDHRKKYLHAQLKQLAEKNNDSLTDDDKGQSESESESLCKQLAELGEEQAAVDAPPDNSHLPGSTIEWKPAENMEEHVPIVFLDLNENSLNESQSEGEEDALEEDFEGEDDFVSEKGNR